jgi:hypothetical protein
MFFLFLVVVVAAAAGSIHIARRLPPSPDEVDRGGR